MQRLGIVTGGTRGIGEAISIAMRDAGYLVAANYVSNDEKAKEFEARTGIRAFKYDVTSYSDCQNFAKQVEAEFSRPIDVLVNNAGITRDGMLHKMSDEKSWDEVIKTNLYSCFNMVSAVINGMRERGFGRIVNIGSINGLKGQAGQANYSAAKAAIVGFTKALALESASKNITVDAVAPGYIRTEMTAAIKKEVLDDIISYIPVKRLGEASEIAKLILFLINDDSGFITGETISANGGQYMS